MSKVSRRRTPEQKRAAAQKQTTLSALQEAATQLEAVRQDPLLGKSTYMDGNYVMSVDGDIQLFLAQLERIRKVIHGL